MRNRILSMALAFGVSAFAQIPFGARAGNAQSLSYRIDVPHDAPVALVSNSLDNSSAALRGGLFNIEARMAVALRNTSGKRIRGVTLAVVAADAAPGGKGSISLPSLDAAPGDSFSVRGDVNLLRPVGEGGNPLLVISLDGILFDDLSFYGPDRLQSRRSLMVWELEARRDRQYFKSILAQNGKEALKREFQDSVVRQSERPQFSVRVIRGRATNTENAREVQVAFLRPSDAPLEPVDGVARVAGNEAEAPRLVIRNRGQRAVRYFEIGWVVRDQQGRDFLAASLPSETRLPAHSSSQILETAALRFDGRAPMGPIASMTGYVSSVEFSDGTFWVASRAHLADPALGNAITPSPEEQRLMQIYGKRGLDALIEELKRF